MVNEMQIKLNIWFNSESNSNWAGLQEKLSRFSSGRAQLPPDVLPERTGRRQTARLGAASCWLRSGRYCWSPGDWRLKTSSLFGGAGTTGGLCPLTPSRATVRRYQPAGPHQRGDSDNAVRAGLWSLRRGFNVLSLWQGANDMSILYRETD